MPLASKAYIKLKKASLREGGGFAPQRRKEPCGSLNILTSCLGVPDALRCRAQDDNVSPYTLNVFNNTRPKVTTNSKGFLTPPTGAQDDNVFELANNVFNNGLLK